MGLTTDLAIDLDGINILSLDDKEALRILVIDFFAATFAGYKQNHAFNAVVEKIINYQGGIDNKKAMGHIGVHVIPAVFALAEKLESSHDEVLAALAIGYEAYIRTCAKLYHLNAERYRKCNFISNYIVRWIAFIRRFTSGH